MTLTLITWGIITNQKQLANMEEDKGGEKNTWRDKDCSFSDLTARHCQHFRLSVNADPEHEVPSVPFGWHLCFQKGSSPASRVLHQPLSFWHCFSRQSKTIGTREVQWFPSSVLQSADIHSNNGQLFQNKVICISQAGYSALGSLGQNRKAILTSMLVAASFSLALNFSQALSVTISSSHSWASAESSWVLIMASPSL